MIAPAAGSPTGHGSLRAALGEYAAALARQPWLERFPLALAAVTPAPRGDGWAVVDAEERWLPVAPRFEGGWQLRALSGGRPLWLFGEWDGEWLRPLSCWGERGCVPLGSAA